jgi:hypothetical protein
MIEIKKEFDRANMEVINTNTIQIQYIGVLTNVEVLWWEIPNPFH